MKAEPSCCVSSDELREFLAAHLSEARQLQVEQHLSACAACQEAIEASAGDKTWWLNLETAMRGDEADGEPLEDCFPDRSATNLLSLLGPTDDPEMLGRIGMYEVSGIIGQGGMGMVLKAFDKGLNRYVAIKMLLPHLAASSAARARFRREGQAAAAVVNDHVLPIYAVDQWQGMPYLVMQYVRGATAQQKLLEQGQFDLNEILRIGLHAAKGLAASHALGLIHRDVKPSNILLDGNVGKAMISDFGLARAADDASLTRSGIIAGTPQYMSPEQIRGEQLDHRSDLFSLGSVLYAISTGQPPFRADSTFAVMRRITDDEPKLVSELRPDLPLWLGKLIAWLMKKEPAERPQHAKAVEKILEQCVAHLEQPHSVSLPNELAEVKVTNKQQRNRRIAVVCTSLILCGLFAWAGTFAIMKDPAVPNGQPVVAAGAQDQGQATTEKDTNANQTTGQDPALPKMTGLTIVEGYEISLAGVGSLDGMESISRFRPKIEMTQNTQQFGDAQNGQFNQTQSFGNGSAGGSVSTSSGGGGGGFTSSGGAGFGYGFKKPNYGIALEIAAKNGRAPRNKNQIIELASAAKIQEMDGTTIEVEDSGPITQLYPQFEKQFSARPGGRIKGIYASRTQPLDSPIKSIEGELKITPGRLLEAEFQGKGKQTKKVEGETFTLESVQVSDQGVQIVAAFPPTTKMKQAKNIMEQMQALMSSNNNYELEIEDTDGMIHLPFGKTSSGSGGGSSQSFSFNGQTRSRTTQQGNMNFTTFTFQFHPLPYNVGISKIRARMTDIEGETRSVPFKIELQSAAD